MIFDRSYGVEIEFLAPTASQAEVAEAISHAGVLCKSEDWNHVTRSHWKVITDGSIITDYGSKGLELVSPPLRGEAGFRQIEKVCAEIKRLGCTVNKSCGLHVHVDVVRPHMPLDAIKRLALLYAENESLIDKVMPANRRKSINRYCLSVARRGVFAAVQEAYNVQGVRKALGKAKYVKLNLAKYHNTGTAEFRHHSGTVEPHKIINWTLACLRMVDTAASGETAPTITAETTTRRVRQARGGSKTALIYTMLTRPEGCTTAEVLAATGWRQASVQCVGHTLGLAIRQVRERDDSGRRVIRYFADRQQALPANTRPGQSSFVKAASLKEFGERIGMTDDEQAYWQKRVELFDDRQAHFIEPAE